MYKRQVLHDIFSGIRVVKAFGMEQKETQRFDEAIEEERKVSVKNETTYNLVSPVVNFIGTIGTFFLLYYTGTRILDPVNPMTLGEATMFTSYVSIMYGPDVYKRQPIPTICL